MKYVSVSAVLSILLLIIFPVHADLEFNEDVRDEVVALFGTLLTPSVFTTAHLDPLTFSVYGRTLTAEGEVPDFDGAYRDEIDQMTIYAGARLAGLGLTIGFGQGSDFEFSQPVILSADYKVSFLPEHSMRNAAIDLQYSVITLPDEEKIRVSALGFGVVSVNGLASAKLLNILEPYVGITLNYIYMNSESEGHINVLKWIPKLGLRLIALQTLSATTEIKLIKNEYLDSAWIWDLGASISF